MIDKSINERYTIREELPQDRVNTMEANFTDRLTACGCQCSA